MASAEGSTALIQGLENHCIQPSRLLEAKGGHNGGAVREPPLRCPPRATGPHAANGLGPIRTV